MQLKPYRWIMNVLASSLSCLSLLLMLPVAAQPAQWAPLLEVDTLAAMTQVDEPMRIIHVTGSVDAGLLPGALFVPYAEFRGPASNAGQLPALSRLTAVLQQAGVDADTPVVVVHQGASASDFGAATRVYWTLKSLGVRHPAVLNGGLHAWIAAGHDVVHQATEVTPSRFTPQWQDTWRITTAELEQSLEDTQIRLLDARPLSFYLGEQAVAARPGTLRGADNLSYESWFDGAKLKPVDELQLQSGVWDGASQTTVSFCNTGHWASINWFVLSELLQVPDTRLYAESVVEWAQLPRPMDNQPGRLAIYWAMTLSWLRQMAGL